MTHGPRLVMNGNPFEIIDTPWGEMEAWRASTMATGTMGALAQVAAIVRNDAAELEKRTVALDAKKHAVLNTVNKLLSFMSRVDALTSRVEALEAKHKADEATQRDFKAEPLELPPDIAEKQTLAPPAEIEDETPAPSGELHAVGPSKPSEPDLEVEDDQAGDLPQEFEEPPDPVPEPKGRVYPQPTAISLNKE
jgi:BMFP domain-containing protein YqiC